MLIIPKPENFGSIRKIDEHSWFVVSDRQYKTMCDDIKSIQSYNMKHVLDVLYCANETEKNCVTIYRCAACHENDEAKFFMRKNDICYQSNEAFEQYHFMKSFTDDFCEDVCLHRESFIKYDDFCEDDLLYWADEDTSYCVIAQGEFDLLDSNNKKAKLFDLAQKNVVPSEDSNPVSDTVQQNVLVSVVPCTGAMLVSENNDKNVKGVIMSTEVLKKSKKSTTQMIKESALHGVKVAAVDEVGETFLDVGKELLGELVPKEVFDTESGRALTKAVTAVLLYHFNGTMLENIEGLDTACSLQIEASSRDLGQPLMKKLKPKLDKLARLGKSAISQ